MARGAVARKRRDWTIAPDPDGSLVDETLSDPTLLTQVQGSSSVVYRRVKHFSGYMVATTRSAETEELQ